MGKGTSLDVPFFVHKTFLWYNGLEDSMCQAGASGAIPRSDIARMDAHADQYYEQIRNRTSDVAIISKNTGFSEKDIEAVKNHIFVDFHDLGETGIRRFDPNYDMVVSWQRLIEGRNIQEMDIVLLNHEIIELRLMSQGFSYGDAHEQAEQLHNYTEFVRKLNLSEGMQ